MSINLNEVTNVWPRLLMSSRTPELELDQVYAAIADVPDDAKVTVSATTQGTDNGIVIPRYGSRWMSLVTTRAHWVSRKKREVQ